MNPALVTPTRARHELVLVATLLVAMSRLVERPDAFLLAGLLPLVVLLAGSGVAGGAGLGRPFEALLVPAVLTGGAAAAIHLVPAGLGLVPALAAFAIVLDRTLVVELRLFAQPVGAGEGDRARVVLAAVGAAFAGFAGMAVLVPGALAEPGGAAGGAGFTLTEGWLIVLAVDDALIALLLGYRVAIFRYGSVADTARAALTYALVVAVAAGAVRAMDLPRLVGPAALTLVFYLWDALHGNSPARRTEPRFLWEAALLGVLAVAVIAWNLRLRA